MFGDTVHRARSGEWRLLDAEGRCFDVADWVLIRPFGGLKGLGLRVLRSVFAAPVLANESKLSLPEFKKKMAAAIKSRYRHDWDKAPASQAIKKLQVAESYRTAIDALPKL